MEFICANLPQGTAGYIAGAPLAVLYFLSMPTDDPWKCFVCEWEGAYMLSLGSRPGYAGQGGCDLNGEH